MKTLREIDLEVLEDLWNYGAWARPLDIGGHDGSHHSRVLAKLERFGLVESRQRGALMQTRGSKEYKAKEAAGELIANLRQMAA